MIAAPRPYARSKPLSIEEVTLAPPGPMELLVRIACAGLCHSDLHFIEALYPIPLPCVLGHEAAAVVEAVGEDVTYVKPGDHVITCLSVFCGECAQCMTGHPNLCENTEVKLLPCAARRLRWKGDVLNQAFNLSAFAEKMLVHEHAVVKIRDDDGKEIEIKQPPYEEFFREPSWVTTRSVWVISTRRSTIRAATTIIASAPGMTGPACRSSPSPGRA